MAFNETGEEMKIKVLDFHNEAYGSVVEAVVCQVPGTHQAVFFDKNGGYWAISNFEVIKENEISNTFLSINKLLGQDVKLIEFK